MNEFIKSIGETDDEILRGIIKLHCPEGFEIDPTYSIGKFYKYGIKKPKYRYDLSPKYKNVIKANANNLPHKDNSVGNIIFDPPFMFGNHGQQKNYGATKRYSMFKTYEELKDMYKSSLKEFYRILIKKGILIFKCQDFTDSKTTMLHSLVYFWARKCGFYAKDIFILINKFKILNTTLKQRHSRKFHSYFWVFVK